MSATDQLSLQQACDTYNGQMDTTVPPAVSTLQMPLGSNTSVIQEHQDSGLQPAGHPTTSCEPISHALLMTRTQARSTNHRVVF